MPSIQVRPESQFSFPVNQSLAKPRGSTINSQQISAPVITKTSSETVSTEIGTERVWYLIRHNQQHRTSSARKRSQIEPKAPISP